MIIDGLDQAVSDRIVAAGIEMLAAITSAYGQEKGLELWNNMGTSMGTDVVGAIFMSMLAGQTSCTVVLVGDQTLHYRCSAVEIIKAIRYATGLGLKESKDIWNQLADGKNQTVQIDHKKRQAFVRDFGIAGGVAR